MSKKLKKKSKRQRKKEQELTMIGDVKEPFTWRGLWEKQIKQRWIAARKFLEEKGILFFLTSPFQYRNRLISITSLIVLCVLVGIVPRALSLIQNTKERNASSELAIIEGKRFASQDLVIRPLMSSHVSRQHVLAFIIEGDTASGVPSTTDGYDVFLSPARGVSDYDTIKMSYGIVPMDAKTRLLLVMTEHQEQKDKTGIYNLNVAIRGQQAMRYGMEIVLSDTQKETELFNGVFVDLSVLATELTKLNNYNSGEGPITRAEQAVSNVLKSYKLTQDRLISTKHTMYPSYEELELWVNDNKFLNGVEDTSTSAIVSVPVTQSPILTPPEVMVKGPDGTEYTRQTFQSGQIDAHSTAAKEFPIVQQLENDVVTKLNALNSTRVLKYQRLYDWGIALNTPILPEQLTGVGQIVKNTQSVHDFVNTLLEENNPETGDTLE